MRTILWVTLLLLGFASSPAKGADVRMFDTLADLAAWVPSSLSSNFTVRTFDSSRPFASARPGHYDAASVASTNAGCVFATSTGVGRNLMDDCNGGEVDATWFGADATGTLASSAAIQAATDYTMQTWGQASKGVVIFPSGTFLIDSTITNAADPLASRTIWRGQTKALIGQHTDEWHTVLKAATNLNAPIVSFSNPRHVAITGIAFNGDRDNQSGFTGTGLVELVGGWGALESDLTDVAVFQSKTNGIYILRHVVQFERVHSVYNDYDGIRFNEYPGGDPTRTLGDCSLQNVQVGFNKGTGIRWNNCWVMRLYNVDVYYNNEDGMSITGGGQFRVFGLQANNNGQNGLLIGGNTRDLVFTDCLIADSNWNQFENYSDTGISEATNSAPSGTYHNINIVGDGNNWETSFIGCRFWQTPGGADKKVGYLLYDGHPAEGQYITMIDPRLIDSTNHWDLGIANGSWLINATMVGTRYGGTNAFTRFAEPVRRTRFTDSDWREVVLIERSDPSPFIRLNRPDTTAWATMDLGKGYFRQYANEGIFEFGNTNSATASGMTRINYLTVPQYTSTNANILMLSGVSRTNGQKSDLRIGGGSSSFDAFNRIIFYTATNYTGSTGGVNRLVIRADGQVDFVPLTVAPTNEVVNGQIYFDTTNGLTQRRGGAWETLWNSGNIVTNIASLVALTPTTGDTRWVQGWTTAGDWGAPRQAVHRSPSALATNLGCVFAAVGGGQWVFPDCESGEVDVRWFGATPDGATDNSASINAAITYAASEGKVAFLGGAGDYFTTSSIELPSNAYLRGTPSAYVVRNYRADAGGYADPGTATIRNSSNSGYPADGELSIAETNIVLDGVCVRSTGTNNIGFPIAFVGVGGLTLRNIKVGKAYEAWAILVAADDVLGENIRINNPGGAYHDGVHVIGGNRHVYSDMVIESGDDSLAVSSVNAVPIRDVVFQNAAVRSEIAHAVRLNQEGVDNTNLIERIAFRNISGISGQGRNGQVRIENNSTNTAHPFRDISISGIQVMPRPDGPPAIGGDYAVYVDGVNGLGLSDIWAGVSVYQNLWVQNSSNVVVSGFRGQGSKGTVFNQTARFVNSQNVQLANSYWYSGATNTTECIVADGVSGLMLTGNRIQQDADAMHALRFINSASSNILVSGNLFQLPSTSAGYAFFSDTNLVSVSILGNDVTTTNLFYFATGRNGTETVVGNRTKTSASGGPNNYMPSRLELYNDVTDYHLRLGRPTSLVDFGMNGGNLNINPSSGILLLADTNANVANKVIRIGVPQYYTSSSPMAAIVANTGVGTKNVGIGGGSVLMSGANFVDIYSTLGTNTAGTNIARFVYPSTAGLTSLRLFADGAVSNVFVTNGLLALATPDFWNTGNDGAGSGLDADTVRGLAFPTNNGAYVLFVTNGVASWIAHP